MTLSKSSPLQGESSAAQPTTVSTSKDPATGRRRYSVAGIDLSSGRSRSNKTCAACGVQKTTRMVTCRACYEASRRTDQTLACDWCKAEFQRPLYLIEKAKRLGRVANYCSAKCSKAHHAVKNAPRCAHCKNQMPGNTGRKFCGRTCRKAALPQRPTVNCGHCREPFVPVSHRSQFCGRACANKVHSARMVGVGNPHFSTGTSYAKLFREMRPLILERDGHACVACKAPAQSAELFWQDQFVERSSLAIHHIDENPTNNKPENLVTLCTTCHVVHHKSAATPWPWFAGYAEKASLSMTSKWRDSTTSLLAMYSSTTA